MEGGASTHMFTLTRVREVRHGWTAAKSEIFLKEEHKVVVFSESGHVFVGWLQQYVEAVMQAGLHRVMDKCCVGLCS